jgi:hypothetical protein
MINKEVVRKVIEFINDAKYLHKNQIKWLIAYTEHYFKNQNINQEDLVESVNEGIRIYFQL